MENRILETYTTEQMSDMIKSFLQRNSVHDWDGYEILFQLNEQNQIIAHKVLKNKGEEI